MLGIGIWQKLTHFVLQSRVCIHFFWPLCLLSPSNFGTNDLNSQWLFTMQILHLTWCSLLFYLKIGSSQGNLASPNILEFFFHLPFKLPILWMVLNRIKRCRLVSVYVSFKTRKGTIFFACISSKMNIRKLLTKLPPKCQI
jgi:hypothetical protein